MGRPRLMLASLMGLVAMVALGMASLFSASTFWTAAAATVTLMLLLGAVLGTILPRGAEWASCLGFALFGVVYFVLVEWDWVGGQLGHDLTAGLIDLAKSMIPSPVVATRSSALGIPIVCSCMVWGGSRRLACPRVEVELPLSPPRSDSTVRPRRQGCCHHSRCLIATVAVKYNKAGR